MPNYIDRTFSCQTNGPTPIGRLSDVDSKQLLICPVNGYTIDCATGITTTPGSITENPLGQCKCNGELWVSEGCTFAYMCDSTEEYGGTPIVCESVSVKCTRCRSPLYKDEIR